MKREKQISVGFDVPTAEVLDELKLRGIGTVSDIISRATTEFISAKFVMRTDVIDSDLYSARRTYSRTLPPALSGPQSFFTERRSCHIDYATFRELQEHRRLTGQKYTAAIRIAVDQHLLKPEFSNILKAALAKFDA